MPRCRQEAMDAPQEGEMRGILWAAWLIPRLIVALIGALVAGMFRGREDAIFWASASEMVGAACVAGGIVARDIVSIVLGMAALIAACLLNRIRR